nr:hypothetical protein [Tanacetum cinerariifolium]
GVVVRGEQVVSNEEEANEERDDCICKDSVNIKEHECNKASDDTVNDQNIENVMWKRKEIRCVMNGWMLNSTCLGLRKKSRLSLKNDIPLRDKDPPYPFDYPMRRLTMEEILAKFIHEGRPKHEMEIFIKEVRTTNEFLLKERSNLLSELKIELNELSNVMSNVLIPKNKVNGVKTRGGKMTSEATSSKEIDETRVNKNKPPRFEQDVQEKPHDDGVENKSLSIPERTTQPMNLKQLDINIPFIEALVQIPKYAKYLKSLLTNKSRLEEAYTETINERCSAVLLNELPLKEKDPRSFTSPCQVLEKHKEAKDLPEDHLSRFENPHMEVLTKREIADKLSNEHLMVLESKFNNDEP